MENIPAVQNTTVLRSAEFVRLNVIFTNGSAQTTRVIGFSTAYKAETIDGVTYTELGGLVGIGSTTRDLVATQGDTTFALTGIDSQYIYFVAGGPLTAPLPLTTLVGGVAQPPIPVGYYPLIKGSEIQFYRGFYNSSQVLQSSVLRYTGIITSYTIEEDRQFQAQDLDVYTIQLNSSSYRGVLERRFAGRKTNEKSWKFWSPTDTSMDRVVALQNQLFDFGKPVASGSPSDPGTSSGNDAALSGGV